MCARDTLHTVLLVNGAPESQELHYLKVFSPQHTYMYIYILLLDSIFVMLKGAFTCKKKKTQFAMSLHYQSVQKSQIFLSLYFPHVPIKISVFIDMQSIIGANLRSDVLIKNSYFYFLLTQISILLHVNVCTRIFQRKLTKLETL